MLPAIFRQVRNAIVDRFAGMADLDGFTTQEYLAGIGSMKAKNCLCQFGSAGSDQSGNANDLSSPNLEVYIFDADGPASQISQFKNDISNLDRTFRKYR